VQLVVSEDKVHDQIQFFIFYSYILPSQAFQLVDKQPFRRLLTYLRPALGEKDIPHRTKLRTEILSRALALEQKLSKVLKVSYYWLGCVYLAIMLSDAGHTWEGVLYI